MQILLPHLVKLWVDDIITITVEFVKIFETCRGQIKKRRQLESQSGGRRRLRWDDGSGAASFGLFGPWQSPPEVRLGCISGWRRTAVTGGTGAGIFEGENLSGAVERKQQKRGSEIRWTWSSLRFVDVWHTCGSSEKHLVAVWTVLTEPSDGWGCALDRGSSCQWIGARGCSAWIRPPWRPWTRPKEKE